MTVERENGAKEIKGGREDAEREEEKEQPKDLNRTIVSERVLYGLGHEQYISSVFSLVQVLVKPVLNRFCVVFYYSVLKRFLRNRRA